jgi:hypothetical protein
MLLGARCTACSQNSRPDGTGQVPTANRPHQKLLER